MRVINAAVLSRGSQNEQTLAQGRKFLSENRLSTLTVFKRSMKLGSVDNIVSDECVEDLAESYMLLISLTGFLDVSVRCS
jgi:nuclear pore complex protein Nup205